MRKATSLGICGLALILVSSCASTRITGHRRPGFDQVSYPSFLVHCDAKDEEIRVAVEETIAARLSRAGYPARSSLGILSEARAYDEKEVLGLMRQENLAAMVRVRVEDWATDVITRPGPTTVFGLGYGHGHHGYGHTYIEFAGSPWEEERSRLRLHLELLDRDSGKISWSGRARLSRYGDRDLYDLADTVGDDLVYYLRREHLTLTAGRR